MRVQRWRIPHARTRLAPPPATPARLQASEHAANHNKSKGRAGHGWRRRGSVGSAAATKAKPRRGKGAEQGARAERWQVWGLAGSKQAELLLQHRGNEQSTMVRASRRGGLGSAAGTVRDTSRIHEGAVYMLEKLGTALLPSNALRTATQEWLLARSAWPER